MGLFNFFSRIVKKQELLPCLDLAQSDSDAMKIRSQLVRGNWQAASDYLSNVRDWDDLDFYVTALTDGWTGKPNWVNEWVEKNPDSEYSALVSGAISIQCAWQARGRGTGDTVSTQGASSFFSLLQQAEQAFLRAAEIAPQNPVPWQFLITTALGLGVDRQVIDDRFQGAVKRYPLYRQAHSSYLNACCEKWGGSHAKTFQIARDASRDAPEGHLLRGLFAEAHIERWLYFALDNDGTGQSQYFKQKNVRDEILFAWEHSLHSPSLIKSKRIFEERNRFAFCFFMMENIRLAREEFQAIGPNFTKYPWAYMGNPQRAIVYAYEEVFK